MQGLPLLAVMIAVCVQTYMSIYEYHVYLLAHAPRCIYTANLKIHNQLLVGEKE